jgi:hypothetical protein
MDTAGNTALDALTAKVEELGRVCAQLSQENAELRAQVLSLPGGAAWSGAWRDAREARGSGPESTVSRGARGNGPESTVSRGARSGLEGTVSRGARGNGAEGTVTRRVLGKALSAAAAGAVGAAALVDLGARPAEASNGNSVTAGGTTTAESRTAVLYDGSSGFGGVVLLGNDSTYDGGNAAFPAALGGWAGAGATAGSGGVPNGIYGFTDNGGGYGVVGVNSSAAGQNGSGVLGMVSDADVDGVTGINSGTNFGAIGVHGVITSTSPGGNSTGVRGENRGTGAQGFGIWGSHSGSGAGLFGQSASGVGVQGNGSTGVVASGASIGLQASGTIAVDCAGTTAVVAAGQGPTGAAMAAVATSSGPTVTATNFGSGSGVRGKGTAGRGGVFSGGPAQVQLVPGTGASHPKDGKTGDLYADKTGRLWFCKKGGTTATWHQIA